MVKERSPTSTLEESSKVSTSNLEKEANKRCDAKGMKN